VVALIIAILLLVFPAFSDYVWLPLENRLHLKLGAEYSESAENFMSDGIREGIHFQNQTAEFTANRFWLEPEYGVTDALAASARGTFVVNNVTPPSENTLVSGSGFADLEASLKWRLFDEPLSVVETSFTIPTYSHIATNVGELVVGDGSFDIAALYHLGFSHEWVGFMLSPGIKFRGSGYSPQALLSVAVEARSRPGYIRVFAESKFSLGSSLLFDKNENQHDALGSGGTYARLSGSPSNVAIGGKVGARVYANHFLEVFLSHSVWGNRSPMMLNIGIVIHSVFDLTIPDTRIRIREIPLDKPAEPTGQPY
jgi:hypothetical protein